MLFDTGHDVGNITEAVEVITKKPLVVALGHGHIDHASGAHQFDGVYLREGDFNLCTDLSYLFCFVSTFFHSQFAYIENFTPQTTHGMVEIGERNGQNI